MNSGRGEPCARSKRPQFGLTCAKDIFLCSSPKSSSCHVKRPSIYVTLWFIMKKKKLLSTIAYSTLVHLEWHNNFPFACTSCFHTAGRYNILYTVCEWRGLVDANKYRICKNNSTELYGFVQPERCIAHVCVKQLFNWMYKRQRWPEKQVFRMNQVAAERILHIRVYHYWIQNTRRTTCE